jgi:hypothetical protein
LRSGGAHPVDFAAIVVYVACFMVRAGIQVIASRMIDARKTTISRFLEQDAAWGARPEVIRRANTALFELSEAIAGSGAARGPLTVEAGFDELNPTSRSVTRESGCRFPIDGRARTSCSSRVERRGSQTTSRHATRTA